MLVHVSCKYIGKKVESQNCVSKLFLMASEAVMWMPQSHGLMVTGIG